MWIALALSLVAVAYNNTINRWKPFHGAAYVPANLAFAGGLLAISVGALRWDRVDWIPLGDASHAVLVSLSVVIFAIVAAGIARSRHAHLIADRRVAGLRGSDLFYHVVVRIPLGTGVTEEVLFRGILFTLWRETGASSLVAALSASAAFGLWHITPAVIGLRMNDPDASKGRVWTAVSGAVVVTTLVGLFLTWLRVVTGGLLAPVLLHGGVNSTGALAAVVASRTSATQDRSPVILPADRWRPR